MNKYLDPNLAIRALLNPKSIAVIGASESQEKFGGRLFKNLLTHHYNGKLYPINSKRSNLFDIKAYPNLSNLPKPPELVVVALPRDRVKEEVLAAAKLGCKAGIIITSKFSDAGEEGAKLEAELVAGARERGMRIMGPNCLGVISPANNVVLCSSPALRVPKLYKAPIGFITQSGALMGTLFDRSYRLGIGFSHCMSVGNQADLELTDFMSFLIDDPDTKVICSYVEGFKTPKALAGLARQVRQAGKTWLMVKAGATERGQRAAFSHTASLAGSYGALRAVCDQENITLLDDPINMLSLAHAMVRYPNSRVNKIGVITTSGGGGAITADRLVQGGMELANFTTSTMEEMAHHYSPGQGANPVDIGGRRFDAPEEGLGKFTAEAVLRDSETDLGLMVLTTAPDVTGLTKELVAGAASPDTSNKPTLYVMMPGHLADDARTALVEDDVPYVDTLAEAVSILKAWKRSSNYKESTKPVRPSGMSAITEVPRGGILDEAGAKRLLDAAGIPISETRVVKTAAEACEFAEQHGFPVVLKILSPNIIHKSDVGGVVLDIKDSDELSAAVSEMHESVRRNVPDAEITGYTVQKQESARLELFVGVRSDPDFGPQLTIGAGGVMVELLRDVTVLPAPTDRVTARRELSKLKIGKLLEALRGRPALDVEATVDVIVRLGFLADDFYRINSSALFELEINPLLVREEGRGVVAVDARGKFTGY